MAKKVNITWNSYYGSFSVFINGIEHVSFVRDHYRGRQSWIEGVGLTNRYFFEIYLDGSEILLGYDCKETWEAVIKTFSQNYQST